jgi:hypothetical protein
MAKQKTEPRLKKLALPRSFALLLFSVPVLIALGAYFTDVVQLYKSNVAPLDPWYRDNTFWRPLLSAMLLLYTLFMFIKQWGYYFELGEGKSGFFVHTAGIFNDAEWGADLLLSLWGGILVLSAWGMPSFWLPCASIYFFLVFLRCRLTLKRKKFAFHWRTKGESAGPNHLTLTSTFTRQQIVAVAMSAGLIEDTVEDSWDTRLKVMESSLDWIHPTSKHVISGVERSLAAKEILAGWDWIDRMYSMMTLVFAVLSWIILEITGTGPATFFTITILGGLNFALFWFWSKYSREWGINNWNTLVE